MNDTDEAKKMDKIYIVEDDDNIRKLVCYALKKKATLLRISHVRVNSARLYQLNSPILFFWTSCCPRKTVCQF